MTGVTGAAGVGKLMGLSEQQLAWAMGIGAVQAGGVRASHGTMCCAFIPGDAGRNGLLAERLAANDFTCHEDALATPHGLLQMFGDVPNIQALTNRPGQHFKTGLRHSKSSAPDWHHLPEYADSWFIAVRYCAYFFVVLRLASSSISPARSVSCARMRSRHCRSSSLSTESKASLRLTALGKTLR